MTTDDILRNALHATAEASDRIVLGSGEHYRAFADANYSPEPSQFCDVDGFGLNADGECERCLRSAAAEQAENDAEDLAWED